MLPYRLFSSLLPETLPPFPHSGIPPSRFMAPDTNQHEKDEPRGGITIPLLQALVVVFSTYGITTLGIVRDSEDVLSESHLAGGLATGLVILFTFTHGIIPMFFYWMFLSPLQGKHGKSIPQGGRFIVRGFIYLHMGIWYLSPMIGLALYTKSLAPAWMVLHILLAGRGNRTWVFLEYGSTAFALLLFVFFVSMANFYPQGLLVVAAQTGILTLANWKGKKLWDSKQASV